MKKIIKTLVFICLAITMLVPTQIFATETGILKSFEIVDFNNGNIETNKYYQFKYETNKEIVGTPDIYLYYVDENGNSFDYGSAFGGRDLMIEEKYKWTNENFKFVFLQIYYDTTDESFVEYYSPYTASEITNICSDFYFEEPIYSIEDKYSFKLTDYDADTTGPNIELVSLTQTGRLVDFKYTGSDTQSYITDVKFNFRGKETYDYFSYSHSEEYKKTQSGTIDLLTYFPDYKYDTYTLESITVKDKAGNSNTISTDKTIVLSADINPLEKIPSMTTTVETDQMDNKVYFRLNDGYGSDSVYTKFYDGDECIYSYGTWIDPYELDLSKESTSKVTLQHTLTITPGKTHSYNYSVDVCIVGVIGTVIDREFDLEICVTYEEYKAHYHDTKATRTAKVKLNTGEIITIEMKPGGFGFAPGFTNDLPYYLEGYSYYYNPMYKMEDESWNCAINLDTRYYIQDAQGNLLDNKGLLRVQYADRKDIVHKTSNSSVNITSLEGSIPTYSVVDAEQTNVDDTFANDYVAYDINLVADDNNVQPVDSVEVSIDIPTELQDKEVEVFYVNEEGETTKHDSTVSQDGKSVTFKTDHFSTYAVVEKSVCLHTETELQNEKESTCKSKGYSGDEVCKTCGETINEGQETDFDMTNHEGPTHLENEKEASCKETGYTGDEVCDACGEVVENGTTIETTDHTYGDDSICDECQHDKNVINTADTTNSTGWMFIVIASAIACFVLIKTRKRYN